jgi:hypothetical protein
MVVPAQPAAPELTAQHAVPAQPVAPPPPQPAAPRPAQVGARGDVPAPPDVVPSAVRRVLPPPAPGQAAAFSPPGQRRITSSRGSAATRVEATIVCLALVVAVAVALALYFGSQG